MIGMESMMTKEIPSNSHAVGTPVKITKVECTRFLASCAFNMYKVNKEK
jgi:serine acetyltransferase